ncbi:putative metal-dependent hydrolase [Rhodovulum iodosum]|uniref:Metal-dependent hydrolase n=1 Tax=Rhodovulum iodosum TaxID=68291 RepID=A0ABV3XSQ9_9RHOB|nr:SprT family zinc-dependent metalloprotease [Rhodovulum robiginosum]RSK30552.1 M48 family peptidase [Rhodovulum robiginosum]
MSTACLPGDPPVTVHIRRSGRARRYSLRISQLDGRVTLTVPDRAPLDEGLAFLREKEGWIRRHLGRRPDTAQVGLGAELPVEGTQVTLVPGPGRAPRLELGQLVVPGPPEAAGARVRGFLKERARQRLAQASDRHAAALGRGYGRLTLRDTRSRWGSCSAKGDLMYSWRLIMAPPAVLDYVAAHEVAHLVEMNHSPAFWAIVARLCPDHAARRAWLHENAASLHRFRFGD